MRRDPNRDPQPSDDAPEYGGPHYGDPQYDEAPGAGSLGDPGREAYDDAERSAAPAEARGCSWALIFSLVLALGLLWAGGWLVHSIANRGLIRQAGQTYHDVSLMPDARVQPVTAEMQVQIYFIARGEALAAETRRLAKTATGIERLHRIAEQLTQPPNSRLFQNPLPKGTAIRGLYVVNGIVWVDLSGDVLKVKETSPLQEQLMVYALVNSFMLNDTSLTGVQIMIDGKPAETIWGWLDLSSPLGQNLALIR